MSGITERELRTRYRKKTAPTAPTARPVAQMAQRRDPITLNGAINTVPIQPPDGKTRHTPDAELMVYIEAIARRYTTGTIQEAAWKLASDQWQAEKKARAAAKAEAS